MNLIFSTLKKIKLLQVKNNDCESVKKDLAKIKVDIVDFNNSFITDLLSRSSK